MNHCSKASWSWSNSLQIREIDMPRRLKMNIAKINKLITVQTVPKLPILYRTCQKGCSSQELYCLEQPYPFYMLSFIGGFDICLSQYNVAYFLFYNAFSANLAHKKICSKSSRCKYIDLIFSILEIGFPPLNIELFIYVSLSVMCQLG